MQKEGLILPFYFSGEWLRVRFRPALSLQLGIPLFFGDFLYFVKIINCKNLAFAFGCCL